MGAQGSFCLEAYFSLPSEQISVLFGPSGVGKSTLLRLVAGLEQPDQGTLRFQNTLWLDTRRRFCMPPQQRALGFVFQDGALFPHLNVHDNLRFGNKDSHMLQEVVNFMELAGLLGRSIHTLSGGQKQRVALARALLSALKTPHALLLLDEPLSALDMPTRTKFQAELKRLSTHFKLTILLVTHDLHEAYALADYVVHIDAKQGIHRCNISTWERFLEQSSALGLLAKVLCQDSHTLTLAFKSPPTLNSGDLAWVSFRRSP
ncbi:ATP-binding cassette domain-containing protein [Helicobacter salomonis]|uniref:ATP-binding cassette domain-containing protein n=1 Tax=Helicobacter salomonis TaxID=56878 RepID=UPI001F181059|nr:ATP-binding cassette domain-containing protein [Helicobacter salomonis]